MKKTTVLLVICFLSVSIPEVSAHPDAEKKSSSSNTPGGTEYVVKPGDTWYSIARKQGITFSELRLANKESEKVLQVGQKIQVPSKAKPDDPRFKKNHTNDATSDSKSGTLTHTVAKGETVFSISKKYNVTPAEIASWNHLKGNTIHVGQVLKVGSADLSTRKAVVTDKEDVKKEESIEKSNPVKVESPITSKSPVKNEKPLSGYVFSNNRQQVTEQGTAASIMDEEVNPGKYYALHRTAPVGTIIKVTNRMNDRSVFVKVVGSLPSTGDNDGLIIKISKSGADKLGVLDDRFQVELLYGVPAK